MSHYFTADGQNVQGPIPLSDIAAMVRQSKLPGNVHVCEPGGQWQPIRAVVPAIQLATSVAAAEAPRPAQTEAAPARTASPTTVGAVDANVGSNQASLIAQAESRPRSSRQAEPGESSALVTAAESSPPARRADQTLAPADFSDLLVESTRTIDPKSHVYAGTGLHSAFAFILFLISMLFASIYLVFATFGIGLCLVLLFGWIGERRARARIQGGGVRVSRDQFPEIYQCTQDFGRRLGMKEVPEVYIVEGSMLNAFATKLGKNNYILLIDDIVHGALTAGETKALSFILGHELAHHALGHTGFVTGAMSAMWKPLSRCNEMTCDAVAADLVENRDLGARGLAMLLVGPQLLRNLNWRALDRQAQELLSKKVWKGAESSMTHPLLVRRYAALRSP